jgi:predicted nucleotidyltransferase
MIEDQQALVDALKAHLERDAGVEAAWLAGSLGAGGGDALSDVDLLVLAGADGWQALSARPSQSLKPALDLVLLNRLFGGLVLNAVTADWGRFDLTLVERDALARYDANALTLLFNRGDASPPVKPAPPPYRTPPEKLVGMANEFLRVIGLSPLGIGRGELQLALSGIDILRRLTFDLMLEENGVAPERRGGALHPSRFLTDAQKAAIAALPTIAAERDSIVRGSEAFAAIFLPRARVLAAAIGAEWPQAFEDATRRHLAAKLGMRV